MATRTTNTVNEQAKAAASFLKTFGAFKDLAARAREDLADHVLAKKGEYTNDFDKKRVITTPTTHRGPGLFAHKLGSTTAPKPTQEQIADKEADKQKPVEPPTPSSSTPAPGK